MTYRAAAAGLLLLVGALTGTARAQTPAAQLAQGLRDYQNLEYDAAARSLRAALARTGPEALSDSERVRALVYLGATDLFGGRRDSAVAAFERVMVLDPRYRIDQLVFPPEVTGLFVQVRLTVRAAALVAPPLTRLQATGDRVVLWLFAASYHRVDVRVTRPDGATVRPLYQGGVGDSVRIEWDGKGGDGAPVTGGQYVARADSYGADGRVVRSVGVPLDITQTQRDTLPLPPPVPESSLKPEHAPGRSGIAALLTGLAAAAAVVALPSVVGGNGSRMPERYVVAGALGIAGVVSFPLQRRPRPLPDNIAANQALRLAWEQRADSVRAENAARRRSPVLVVRAAGWRPVRSP